MKGLIHLKLARIQLLLIPLALLHGCASSPTVTPMAMAGIKLAATTEQVISVEPRTLNFTFEDKQIELTKEQRNRLLYLYDWKDGAIITYGKAKAENDYIGLSLGHKRVQVLSQSLNMDKDLIKISYDPSLVVDSVIIEERIIQEARVTTEQTTGLLEGTRL